MSNAVVDTHTDTFHFKGEDVTNLEVTEDGRLVLLDEDGDLVALFNTNQWVSYYRLPENEE